MRPSNIILIVVDDLGFGGLGCYGQRLIQTPHLDRMAQEGMRFEQHYAGSGVCAPSRAVLLTGKHAGHASVRGNTGGIPLPEGEVTLATLLSQAGYACGGFGKWGLGDAGTPGAPERQGFDVFFGYYHQIHAHDYFPEYLWRNGAKVSLTGNEGGGRQVYSHYLIFAEMLRWIRSHKDGPFFCYAPWTLPHGRYEIPADEPALRGYIDRPWPETARIYAGMISLIDRCVGELLALLKELGIDQETNIFFTSDHGAHAAERSELTRLFQSNAGLRGGKTTLYEGGIRVPLIVRWPGRVPAGAVSRHVSSFADMLPTLAELAWVPLPSIPRSRAGVAPAQGTEAGGVSRGGIPGGGISTGAPADSVSTGGGPAGSIPGGGSVSCAATDSIPADGPPTSRAPADSLSTGGLPTSRGPTNSPLIDGISLVPTLLGEKAAGRRQEEHPFLYWECGGIMEYITPVPMQAVRFGPWKAVRHRREDAIELYNLAEDEGERNDLSRERPDLVAEAERLFSECHTEPPPQLEPEREAGRKFR